ncbi:hypothetical protein CLV62_12070 [Dysgonomonas alginatilytica]|uniref:Uncharacterized protein n=1 Tax=Dysgonomonas alginatilytica TaxID=1605892 RepID=A0A2V3PN26_9BACT|nr:hypothetical protein [Dysgonomonas alginatilytica]PXV62381.1 hypothetical protein CLV62_12070 [Dysgonomonas alginatilytica]
MNVSEILKTEAIKYDLCSDWTNDWGTPSLEELVDKYIKGLDFCILNNYPSNEFIKKNFGKIAEGKGVFVDSNVNLLNPKIAILNGSCSGEIVLNNYVSRDIHVRHDSIVKIIIRDGAIAFIRVYDNAHVVVENESGSRCFVYKKGGRVTISGDVLVRG